MKLQLLENITPNDIIKTLLGKNYYLQAKSSSLTWKENLFSFRQQEGRKLFLSSEIRENQKKPHIFKAWK